MKHLLPQFPPILAIYWFCMLQIPSSGFSQRLANPPDGLDIVQLECLAYCLKQWETLPNQPKENQDVSKRFLFQYSRTQEQVNPVNTGFPPVHPVMCLAAKLDSRRMKRFLPQDLVAASVDFTKKARELCENKHFQITLEKRTGLRTNPLPHWDGHFSSSGQGMEDTLTKTKSSEQSKVDFIAAYFFQANILHSDPQSNLAEAGCSKNISAFAAIPGFGKIP